MRKARGFSLFPSTFPRKNHLSKKRSCVLLAPLADGLTPAPARMHHRGLLEAAALNEAGFTVRAETYEYAPTVEQHELLASLVPQAEIAELRWVNPAMSSPFDSASQAPLNTEQIFPLLARTPLP